jgi:hypothetical protein
MLLTQVCAQRALEPAVAQSMLQALMRAVDAEVAAPAALAKPLLCVVRDSWHLPRSFGNRFSLLPYSL